MLQHATWYWLQAQSGLTHPANTVQLGCKGCVGGSVVSNSMLSPLGLPVQGNLLACGCSYSGETPCGTSLLQKESLGLDYPVL